MPIVSVIMPCFNHARFLGESISSVLGQTLTGLELIITDDCSSDRSWDEMSRFARADSRVKLIRHARNQGLPKSRNDGLKVAAGEFIAFCDSDDIWEANKLETQVSALRRAPAYGIVYCDTRIIDGDGKLTGQRFSELYPLPGRNSGWLFEELVDCNFINVQSALMRRECLKSVDHFDEDLGVLEDWWYWVQLSRTHRFLYLKEPLARYRVHSQSMNAMKRRCFPITRIKIYRRLLCRYRDLGARATAGVYYTMGVDCCSLGKYGIGRRLFWKSARCSWMHISALGRLSKVAVRLASCCLPRGFRTSRFPLAARSLKGAIA